MAGRSRLQRLLCLRHPDSQAIAATREFFGRKMNQTPTLQLSCEKGGRLLVSARFCYRIRGTRPSFSLRCLTQDCYLPCSQTPSKSGTLDSRPCDPIGWFVM